MAYNRLSNYATTISHDKYTGKEQVIYHSTSIVKWDISQIILNTGGFNTATTKRKMNQASRQFNLGYSVYQNNFTWYVEYQGKTQLFKDGMILER